MESLTKIKTSIDCFQNDAERSKLIELLEFIQEELLNSNAPRKFVVQSALNSLKINETSSIYLKELVHLEQLTAEYLG